MRTIFSFLTLALVVLSGQAQAELVFGGNSLASTGPGTYSFEYSITASDATDITSFNLPFAIADGVTFSNFSANPVFAQSSTADLPPIFMADVGFAGSVGTLSLDAGATASLFTADFTIDFDPASDIVIAAPVTTGFASNVLQLTDTNNAAIDPSEFRFTEGFTITAASAIPEPSSFAILGAASCLCMMRRKRRV